MQKNFSKKRKSNLPEVVHWHTKKYTKVKTTRMSKFAEPQLKKKISLQPTFAETALTELEEFPEKNEKILVSRKQ